MSSQETLLSKLQPHHDDWTVKVRVDRLWNVYSLENPHSLYSIELIFVDELGHKIQASITHQVLDNFNAFISEGGVYVIRYLDMISNEGPLRPTRNPYRLLFQYRTQVCCSQSTLIPNTCLQFVPYDEVKQMNPDSPYLIDVIGLLTGVSTEGEVEDNGKKEKLILIELTAPCGKIECALFGEHVRHFMSFMAIGAVKHPVVVLHFGKVQPFGGRVFVQSALEITRLMFNPDIPEAFDLLNNLGLHHGRTPYGGFTCLESNPLNLHFGSKTALESNKMNQKSEHHIAGTVVENAGDLHGGRILFKFNTRFITTSHLDDLNQVKRICDSKTVVKMLCVPPSDIPTSEELVNATVVGLCNLPSHVINVDPNPFEFNPSTSNKEACSIENNGDSSSKLVTCVASKGIEDLQTLPAHVENSGN